jgi:hypothetical protein
VEPHDGADAKLITEWIVDATVAGDGETEILAGICERLNAAGLSLVRTSVACNVLDPIDSRAVRWLRQRGRYEEVGVRSRGAPMPRRASRVPS